MTTEQINYDSTNDTLAHIQRVGELLYWCACNLMARVDLHDQSKLQEPEKSAYDRLTTRLKGITYGSPEYKASLAELGDALRHHYAVNRHHPEHYANGIDGMSLFDLLEMLCDWKAAGERHADGCIKRSLKVNSERFKISDQLASVLHNTAVECGWIKVDEEEEMTPKQINKAIAESVGWTQTVYGGLTLQGGWFNSERLYCQGQRPYPDYYNDLNAIHEVVNSMEDRHAFCASLVRVYETNPDFADCKWFPEAVVQMKAYHWCEAYLRTMGKLEE